MDESYEKLLEKLSSNFKKERIDSANKYVEKGYHPKDLIKILKQARNEKLEDAFFYICSKTGNFEMGWNYLWGTVEENWEDFNLSKSKMKSTSKNLIAFACENMISKENFDIFINHMMEVNISTVEHRRKCITELNNKYKDNLEDFSIQSNLFGVKFYLSKCIHELNIVKTDFESPLSDDEIDVVSQCSSYSLNDHELNKIRKYTVYQYILLEYVLGKIISSTDDLKFLQSKLSKKVLFKMVGYNDFYFIEEFFRSQDEVCEICIQECQDIANELKELILKFDHEQYLYETYMANKGVIKSELILNDYLEPVHKKMDEFIKSAIKDKFNSPFLFVSDFLYKSGDNKFNLKLIDDFCDVLVKNEDKTTLDFLIYYLYKQSIIIYNPQVMFVRCCLDTKKFSKEFLENYFMGYKELIYDVSQYKLLTDVVCILIGAGSEDAFGFFVNKMYENNSFDTSTILNYAFNTLVKEKDTMYFEKNLREFLDVEKPEDKIRTALSFLLYINSTEAKKFFFDLINNDCKNLNDKTYFKKHLVNLMFNTQLLYEKKKIRLDLGMRWELICRKIVEYNLKGKEILYHTRLSNDKVSDILIKGTQTKIIECKLSPYFVDMTVIDAFNKNNIYDEADKYLQYCDVLEYWVLREPIDFEKINIDKVVYLFLDDLKTKYYMTEDIMREIIYIQEMDEKVSLTLKTAGKMEIDELCKLYNDYEKTKYTYTLFNSGSSYIGKKNTIKSEDRRAETIKQYDLLGNFVNEFENISHAAQETNISRNNSAKVVNGRQNSAGEFIWRKAKKDSAVDNISPPESMSAVGKLVCQINLSGEIIDEFNTISNAAKTTGINRKSIRDAIAGKQKTAGGYMWIAVDTEESIKEL